MMNTRDWWNDVVALAIAALIIGVLLAAGVADAADVVLSGPTKDLRSDPHVKKAYLGL
jgi:hypothetical protein